jgi:Tol biopolymer transport system component
MKKYNKALWLTLILFLVLPRPHLWAQQFGLNKIQYENKKWEFIQSEHFDLYYYQGGRQLAEFTASVAESAYVQLSRTFDYKLVDRIPIIIYRSHNDFTETNLSGEVVEESVGGFTEFLKNRVVLPFEGSYEMFRHVIHHELTHAVMLQFLYGSGAGSVLAGVTRMNPPTWFSEGLAEFQSLGWDTDSDMFVRDAALHGYLPHISSLQAYLAYKGGQAVWLYIDEIYGAEKRTELLQRIRSSRNFERAWRSAFNEPVEETSKKWQTYMRKKYWPEIAHRQEPTDYAQALTDHVKWQNFINNSPAVSPTGDRVAFLSDRTGYFDIYVVSATDPKQVTRLVAGQRKANLEELHWLRPGMGWSPDGKNIVFASRAGQEDALNILDVDSKKITASYKFGMDGLFSPAWSPTTDEIAFVGMKNCCSDIYVYNLDSKQLRKVTDDIFSDLEPTWSPDGKDIAFVSDRKENVEPNDLRKPVHIEDYDYHTTDIYLVHADGLGLRRLTTSSMNERSPQWSPDGKKLLYVSDQTGIGNIYSLDMETGEEQPLTDLLTGCAQLSWGVHSDRLAFTAFSNGGYDIFLWINPFHDQQQTPQPVPTTFVLSLEKGERIPSTGESPNEIELVKRQVQKDQDYSHFVFDDNFKRGIIENVTRPAKPVTLSANQYKDPEGDYKTHPYKMKFSIDNVGFNGGYDPIYGLVGLTQLSLSDELGDHQIQIGANVIQSLANSDFLFAYQNLKHRINWSMASYQFVYFYATNYGIYRFANRGVGLESSYPLSRFKNVDLGLQYINIAQDNLTYLFFPNQSFSLILPTLSYTTNNSLLGYTAPYIGKLYMLSLMASPKIGSNGKEFATASLDLRRYLAIDRNYGFAFRLSGGASFGKNPTLFILGGLENWFNYRYSQRINYISIADFFLSDFMTPLRGADLYELVGSRAALLNMEFRFPLVRYFITDFPLKLGFQNIRGCVFFDAGSAWSNDSAWRFTDRMADGSRYVRDIVSGFGYGIRTNLAIFLLKIDAAWRTDFDSISSPKYYFSIGTDF